MPIKEPASIDNFFTVVKLDDSITINLKVQLVRYNANLDNKGAAMMKSSAVTFKKL